MNPALATAPGLMLSSELPPGELIEHSVLAEELGYLNLWYTDQRFWRECYSGLSLIAQNTSRIRIGPGVNDPFTRHPALIAMAVATLDEASGGRAQLGLGAGGSGIAQMKLPKQRPVRALSEAIDIIRAMLTGETVHYQGDLFELDGGALGFTPIRTDVPIYIATHGPQILKLSGKMADGVLLGNMGRREAVDHASSIVRHAEAQAGRPEGGVQIDLRLEAIITEDRSQAFSVMKKRMAHRLVVSFPNWGFLGEQEKRLDPGIAEAARLRNEDTVERLLTEDDVRSSALVGDPDDVAEQLARLLSPEVSNVTIRPYGYTGMGQDITIRLFAERVWPAVRAGVVS